MKKRDLLLNLISPPRCMACNRKMSVYETAKFCHKCGENYHKVNSKVCRICGKPIGSTSDDTCRLCKEQKFYINQNVSRYLYKGSIKDAVQNMKFKRKQWIAFEFGRSMVETVKEHYSDINFDLVLYVPMTKLSVVNRGFNQSLEIAEIISESLKIPIEYNILHKKINTKTQSGLGRKERFENVKNAFFIRHSEKLTDKVILLIDDVYTTGATINECARMLKKSGALAVYSATVAATVLDE